MNELQAKAILAGLFFGIWPLLMNRSGLGGNISALVFSVICTVCLLPFAFGNTNASLAIANWTLVSIAGVLGALGLFFFNGVLAKAMPEKVGMLIVLAIVAQTSIPALYSVFMNGGITISKGVGFAAAILAIILLL